MTFQTKTTAEFKPISVDETFKFLGVARTGLSGAQIQERLSFFGRNELAEKKKNPIVEFLGRYWGPMPWLLELAMLLSFVLRHNVEGIIIFALLTVNAIIGFMHTHGSQKAVELLKQRLAVKARILRNGEWGMKEAGEIVPGDIVLVRLGDIVPADAKVIEGHISIDESALTGESLPAERETADVIYSGSIVRQGEAKCVALNTGSNTYFGRTTELVKIAKPKSHQEEIMLAIVRYSMYLGIAASALVTAYGFVIHTDILLILTFIVALLMGAVPVALPAVMTIVESVTAMKLAQEGVLVTRLDSIEDAASISVLCLDKTGTITQNKLTVADSVPAPGIGRDDLLRAAALASRSEGMDLIDEAVIRYAKEQGVHLDSERQVAYSPFSPATRRTEAVIESKGIRRRIVKGATQVVLSMCKGLDDAATQTVNSTIAGLTEKGYRTLAVAQSKDSDLQSLQLMGLLPLADPPRPDSKKMISEMREVGVKPIMLTGDSQSIAREIATQVGIGSNFIRLSDLKDLSEQDQAKAAAASDGFAEVYPEDKYKIVKLLQTNGYIVGMTGDGVNDAPALKQAEMGIAVDNATDVAKAAASVVLTQPGVSVIVDAIERSRETYQRMLTWVINKITKVIQVVGILTVGYFLSGKMVLSLLGMSLLVFANDFVTMSLATDNVQHTASPNNWNVRSITFASLIVGTLLVVEGLVAYLWGARVYHLSFDRLQTFIMLLLVFTSQFRVIIVRERNWFWSSRPGKALLASTTIATGAFILLGSYGVIVPPIAFHQVLAVLLFSAVFTLLLDFPKRYAFRIFGVE